MTSSNTELNKHNIIPVLDVLRTSPKSKQETELFEKIAKDKWKTLQLEGEPNPILLENMLIYTIKELYGKPDSTFDDNSARWMQARKHDISLLMFGLLDGYYHTKLDTGQKICVTSKMRYEQYLDTNVFTDLEYPGEGTYKEIEEADKKCGRKESRPLNLIRSIAGNCKAEIGVALLGLIRSGNYKNCSQGAEFDEETGQRIDLPKARYTLERFGPKDWRYAYKLSSAPTTDSSPESAPVTEEPTQGFAQEPVPKSSAAPIHEATSNVATNTSQASESTGDKSQRGNGENKEKHVLREKIARVWATIKKLLNHLRSNLITLLLVIIAFSTSVSAISEIKLAFFQTDQQYQRDISSVPVEEIYCEAPSVEIFPGQTLLLPLNILPDEASNTILSCSSSNSGILETMDGDKALVRALKISDPEAQKVKVMVTVTPQNRVNSDVYVEVPVIVDYSKTIQAP